MKKRTMATYPCATCGKDVNRTAGNIVGRIFCSRDCCNKAKIGVASRRRKMAGPDHPRWKGGRVVKQSGYVLIHVPDHPAADEDGYVAEQRLVMEKSLGRPLEPSEHVYRLNRNRSDNRPENLTLNPPSKYRPGAESVNGDTDTEPFALSSDGFDAGPKKPRTERYRPTIIYRVLARAEARFSRRFWEQVDRDGPGGCWLWTGSKDEFGYGRPHLGGLQFRSHRYSYEVHNGPIPEGDWVIRHTCDVPACVNPAHLIIGTKLDNARDRDRRGRSGTIGSKNRSAKLTEDQVREIRRRWTGAFGQVTEFCREYGIKAPALYGVIKGTTWKHVT